MFFVFFFSKLNQPFYILSIPPASAQVPLSPAPGPRDNHPNEDPPLGQLLVLSILINPCQRWWGDLRADTHSKEWGVRRCLVCILGPHLEFYELGQVTQPR